MFKPVAMAALMVGAVLWLAVSGHSAPAQQFSADLARTDAGGTATHAGKLNVSHDKVRIETSDLPAGFFLILAETDTAYFVRPAQKTFMDAKQSSPLTQVFVTVDPDDPCIRWQAMTKIAGGAKEGTQWRCERIGDDTVNGRRAVKYRSASPEHRQRFGWIDPQLRFPVRLQYEDGTVVDLVNIQEMQQPESLFVIPADYRKFDPQQLIDRIKQSDVWVEPVDRACERNSARSPDGGPSCGP